MSIRLIASDMDGTLLDPYTNITEANREAIRRLPEYGVEFLICSGRDYADAHNITESNGISCNYICLSGAAVYENDGKPLSSIPLTAQNLSDITKVFAEYGAPLDILSSNGRFSTGNREKKLAELYSFLNGRKPLPKVLPEELKQAVERRISGIMFIINIAEIPDSVKIYKAVSYTHLLLQWRRWRN